MKELKKFEENESREKKLKKVNKARIGEIEIEEKNIEIRLCYTGNVSLMKSLKFEF